MQQKYFHYQDRQPKMRRINTAWLLLLTVLLTFPVPQRLQRARPTSAEAKPKTNTATKGAKRPPIDTDGAIYQKTVGGVTFRIVAMCQDFEVLMNKNTMEFDTVQNGCRFTLSFPSPPRGGNNGVKKKSYRKTSATNRAVRRNRYYATYNRAQQQPRTQSSYRPVNPYVRSRPGYRW